MKGFWKKQVCLLAVSMLLISASAVFGQGMDEVAYRTLLSKSNPTFIDVLVEAGEPDLIKEGPVDGHLSLFYFGDDEDGHRTTLVILDRGTKRVIKIERIR